MELREKNIERRKEKLKTMRQTIVDGNLVSTIKLPSKNERYQTIVFGGKNGGTKIHTRKKWEQAHNRAINLAKEERLNNDWRTKKKYRVFDV